MPKKVNSGRKNCGNITADLLCCKEHELVQTFEINYNLLG